MKRGFRINSYDTAEKVLGERTQLPLMYKTTLSKYNYHTIGICYGAEWIIKYRTDGGCEVFVPNHPNSPIQKRLNIFTPPGWCVIFEEGKWWGRRGGRKYILHNGVILDGIQSVHFKMPVIEPCVKDLV